MKGCRIVTGMLVAGLVAGLLETAFPGAAASDTAGALVQAVGPIGMTVSDMDRSIEFYSRVLTFEKLSDVELAGPEIERLQGVFGARARVVRMRLGDEQIELTEYLAPRDGRLMPPDEKANDLVHWQTRLVAGDLEAAEDALRRHHVPHLSPGVVALPDGKLGFPRGVRVRDPDGHVMEVVTR
ncbi:MAG TPA: VOC family protein [Candidatus Eisenbacteria bacterium]|jgi:catechol 2,3-dioxygenase-like lactoylglutathione lyase family enzyme